MWLWLWLCLPQAQAQGAPAENDSKKKTTEKAENPEKNQKSTPPKKAGPCASAAVVASPQVGLGSRSAPGERLNPPPPPSNVYKGRGGLGGWLGLGWVGASKSQNPPAPYKRSLPWTWMGPNKPCTDVCVCGWRMEETTWSLHKKCKRLDRAGRGNSTNFWYITHEGLVKTVEWEMSNNTYIISAGKLWTRQDCIPMGGSFSAQSANLHSLWSVYTYTDSTHRHLFRQLGTLKIAEQGFIYWENARGKVSLQQFRDNILIASTYPDSPETALVHAVRGILQQAWGLTVLCDCCTSDSDA